MNGARTGPSSKTMEETKESKCAFRHEAADREPPRKKDSQIKSSEETQYFFSASIAAGSCKFVANRSKVFVPCLGEAGDKLLRGAPSDGHTGMDDVSPGMHPRPLSRVLFKADPLGQDDTKGVVDPSHFMSRLAIGDDVIYNGFDGLQDLNLQAASGFPRPAFAPAHSAINVCKFIPTPPIRKNLPAHLAPALDVSPTFKPNPPLLPHPPFIASFPT